jgi:hypothetical protein
MMIRSRAAKQPVTQNRIGIVQSMASWPPATDRTKRKFIIDKYLTKFRPQKGGGRQ